MRESSKSLITGMAKGALKGAMFGAIAVGLLGVGTAIAGIGPFALAFAGGLNFFAYGVTAVAVFANSVMGGMAGWLGFGAITAATGGAMMGACYKGVSDFIDMEETIIQKDKMVDMAKTVNAVAKTAPQKTPEHRQYVPKKVPQTVAKDEMPGKWVQAENARRAAQTKRTPPPTPEQTETAEVIPQTDNMAPPAEAPGKWEQAENIRQMQPQSTGRGA